MAKASDRSYITAAGGYGVATSSAQANALSQTYPKDYETNWLSPYIPT